MSTDDKTTGSLRISKVAYKIAKGKAKEHGTSMCKWISEAIVEKALLDDLMEDWDVDKQK